MARLLAVLVLVGIFAAFATGGFERLLLYPFDPTRTKAPAFLTETELETPDGERLVVWFAKPRSGRPVVQYFNGNAGNLGVRTGRFKAFTDRGFGVLAAGYRGSSGSTGKPTEADLIGDAEVLADARPGLVGNAPVVYYGESLGAAVAISLARTHAPQAMVLEAPFASIAEMSATLSGTPALARILTSQWPSVERIASLSAPLLVLHGRDDIVVPIAQGRAVFDAAASRDKRFIAVDSGHTDVWNVAAQRAIYQFLGRF